MTADDTTEDSGAPKKRRVPTPRKSGGGEAGGRVPARRVPGKRVPGRPQSTPEVSDPAAGKPQVSPLESTDSPVDSDAAKQAAAQQAAAKQAAAKQAAAKQAAAKQAAAKQAAAKQAAAKQAAAKQAAAQQAAAQQAAAQQAAAKQSAAKQAAAKQVAAKQIAARKIAAQQSAAKSASEEETVESAPRRRTGAPVGRGARGRAPRRKAQPQSRSPVSAKGQVGADPSMGDESQPSRGRLPLIIGAVAVVAVLILVVIFNPFSEPELQVEPEPVVQEPQIDPQEQREEKARKAFARIEEENRKEPGDRYGAAHRYQWFASEYANTTVGQEASNLRAELLVNWRSAVDQQWLTLKGDIRGAFQSGEFQTAVQMLENLPPIFEGAEVVLESSFETELDNLRNDAQEQFRYKRRLDELSAKAGKYARKGYDDIAIATIEALDERVEEEAPDVWKLKQDLVKRIQREGLAMLIEQEGVVEAELAEARRLEEEQKKAEREQRWRDLRESVAWSNQLASTNLYNWVVTSDRQLVGSGQAGNWRVLERDGSAVLVGSNQTGGEMHIGLFSNHWEDYVCQFEVNIREGALRISPRTNSRGGAIGDQTSPQIELADEFPKSRWVKCTMEVHGDQASLKYGDDQTEIVLDPETTRLPSAGGFVFSIDDGTRLEMRDVRVKVISDTRDGGIWAR